MVRKSLPRRSFLIKAMLGMGPFLSGRPGRAAPGDDYPVRFEDVAARAGLTIPTTYGGASENRYILETTGCGAAVFDDDNDGWLDLFLVNGTTLDSSRA